MADISPLPYLKQIYDKYNNAKDSINDKLANELDLTKDKSAKEGLKTGLDLALDPLNAMEGPVGLGLSALQMGLEALPDKAPEIAGAAALGVAKKPQFGSVTVMDQGVKVPNKILYGPNGRPVNLPAELVDGAKAKALMGLIRRRP